ncbi:MAG: trimeric intracellular cation channel family protein [Planctomycetaceae bacterium]|nr:trimeric intracellular cation channel family protein [Planctomycetaceae bacterium]
MLDVLSYVGVGVFAVSGAISAGRKRLDLIAVLLVAMVTALGGGTLRDLVLDVRPILWVEDNTYIWVALVAATATMVWQRRVSRIEPALVYADAAGLALFSVLATQRALLAGASDVVAVLMGIVTSIVGGILRDVLCGDPPLVMRGEVYATCALLGSIVFLGLRHIGAPVEAGLLIGAGAALVLRILAIELRLRIPLFHWHDDPRRRR